MPFHIEAFLADLTRLKIPAPDRNIICDIYDIEGEYIPSAIAEIDRGNKKADRYLRGIFSTVTPQVKEKLQRRRLMIPPLEVLVEIGKREGLAFATRLDAWDNHGSEGEDSRYVRLTLADYLQRSRERSRNKNTASTQQAAGNKNAAQSVRNDQATSTSNRHREIHNQQLCTSEESTPNQSTGAIQDQNAAQKDKESGVPDDSYLSHHIYGGKVAACFSADVTRSGCSTIRIEAAEAQANRQYNWKDKIGIQLSSRELPLVLATLMQWIESFEGKGHGQNNEKWFTLQNQVGKIYLSVNCRGKAVRGVPIMPGDAYSLCTLIMRQMLKNDPFLSSEALLLLVRKQAEIIRGMAVHKVDPSQQRTHSRIPDFAG